MQRPASPAILDAALGKRCAVHWMNGWDWAWMSFMMVFWIGVLGAIVYAAIRLAQRPPNERR
jgi:hypothetical protein